MKLDDTRTFNALTETPENMTVRELNQAIRDLRELLHEQTIRAQEAEGRFDATELKSLLQSGDNWLPANNGTETPFITRTGHRLLYVWQPSTDNHAYLDCETDVILSDVDAQLILDK